MGYASGGPPRELNYSLLCLHGCMAAWLLAGPLVHMPAHSPAQPPAAQAPAVCHPPPGRPPTQPPTNQPTLPPNHPTTANPPLYYTILASSTPSSITDLSTVQFWPPAPLPPSQTSLLYNFGPQYPLLCHRPHKYLAPQAFRRDLELTPCFTWGAINRLNIDISKIKRTQWYHV